MSPLISLCENVPSGSAIAATLVRNWTYFCEFVCQRFVMFKAQRRIKEKISLLTCRSRDGCIFCMVISSAHSLPYRKFCPTQDKSASRHCCSLRLATLSNAVWGGSSGGVLLV